MNRTHLDVPKGYKVYAHNGDDFRVIYGEGKYIPQYMTGSGDWFTVSARLRMEHDYTYLGAVAKLTWHYGPRAADLTIMEGSEQ